MDIGIKTVHDDGYASFLNEAGRVIYDNILQHCKDKGASEAIDIYELAMLANSFAAYAECADYCNEHGFSMSFTKAAAKKTGKVNEDTEDEEPGKAEAGIYQQVRPEYTVMNKEYQNILKHSPKFGINPGDRAKLFKGAGKPKKKIL